MSQKPWLASYPTGIPASLEYPDMLLSRTLEEAYHKNKNHIAIRFLGKSLTYQEVYESALSFAHSLKDLGVKQGDRVSLMLPNIPQYIISYYGILMAGGIVVNTSPLYVERELEYQLNDAGAETIIGLDLVYPKIAKVKALTSLKNVIITSIKDYLPFPKNILYPFVQKKQGMRIDITYGEHILSFTNLVKRGKVQPIPLEGAADDVAVIQYTGGTTGVPKGVMLTHRNLVVNAFQCKIWLTKAEYGEEKSLAVVPFFHVYGMTVVMIHTILLGSTLVILPKFDPKDVLKAIDKEKPTLFPGAPTIYIALLNHHEISKYDLASINACISGSAPLPIEVQQKFEEITGGKLVEGYGMTETSPVTLANPVWSGKRITGSVGLPWPDTEAVVLSLETREPVPVGEVGEIAIKGPQVMKGYWNKPEDTAAAFHNEWFLTGDMGYMDESGYFYMVDRKKDMIIAGGYNIYPREIEEVLYEHPAIQECVVAGVPDPYRGETVKAYIVFKEGQNASEEELNEYCRKKLAAYKIPRIYEYRNELPKSMIGKILRRVLVKEEIKKLAETSQQEQSTS